LLLRAKRGNRKLLSALHTCDCFVPRNDIKKFIMPLILPVKDKSPSHGAMIVSLPKTLPSLVMLLWAINARYGSMRLFRGDVNYIKIGNNSNIQDGAVIHCTYNGAATNIGNYVSIGHNALVHGCTLKDHSLVGMGAIVMDNAVVEEYVIIGAGSVVLERTVCESGYLYAGTPAKKIKPLNRRAARHA
jgi:hypothetical protein